ncbi:MAG: hypothetical protein WDW36_003295 [Sanguina aurantia]
MQHLLVVGGSGYLGQFLLAGLSQSFQITYTYGKNRLQTAAEGTASAAQVDCSTGEGFSSLFLGQVFHAVINCAAISQPGVCEKDPASARSINIPTHLIAQLRLQQERAGVCALLLHISTDQVYDGSHALSTEEQACHPVNVYGRSKLEAEQAVQAAWPHHVILRSSIIYGPPPPQPVSRALFLQFVEGVLRDQRQTSFFDDEWRSPIFVGDIVKVCDKLLGMASLPAERKTYNMGGPERLSRVDMAHQVAEARGFGSRCILPASASSVDRGVASPADISMDSSELSKLLGMAPLAFAAALQLF